jgi:hypothetical protein
VYSLLTRAALLCALLGVVTGNLYRTCDCAHDAGAARHGGAGAVLAAPALPACCRHAAPESQPKGDGHDAPAGCTICCKPRAPLSETNDPVEMPAPLPFGIAMDLPVVAAWHAPLPRACRPDEGGRRTSDPWLLSPEGLTVFLI